MAEPGKKWYQMPAEMRDETQVLQAKMAYFHTFLQPVIGREVLADIHRMCYGLDDGPVTSAEAAVLRVGTIELFNTIRYACGQVDITAVLAAEAALAARMMSDTEKKKEPTDPLSVDDL